MLRLDFKSDFINCFEFILVRVYL